MSIEEFVKHCYSYNESNQRYESAQYYDTGNNGSFMGMKVRYTADVSKYDSYGQCIDSKKGLSGEYSLKLSPIQFYQMARQLMAFCNKEFGTQYDTSFQKPSWVRPTFCDEETDYNKKDFPIFLNTSFPIEFRKHENYYFKDGRRIEQEPTYKMFENSFGGTSWGEHEKGYYLSLAAGFDDYIKNAKTLPKGMSDSYNLYLMQATEEKFGLRPKYTLKDFNDIIKDRILNPASRSLTDEQKKILGDFFRGTVTKTDVGLLHFDRCVKDLPSNTPDGWIKSAREELADFLNGKERTEYPSLHR